MLLGLLIRSTQRSHGNCRVDFEKKDQALTMLVYYLFNRVDLREKQCWTEGRALILSLLISTNTGIHNSIIVKQSLSLKALISTIVERGRITNSNQPRHVSVRISESLDRLKYLCDLSLYYFYDEVDVVDVTIFTNNF